MFEDQFRQTHSGKSNLASPVEGRGLVIVMAGRDVYLDEHDENIVPSSWGKSSGQLSHRFRTALLH